VVWGRLGWDGLGNAGNVSDRRRGDNRAEKSLRNNASGIGERSTRGGHGVIEFGGRRRSGRELSRWSRSSEGLVLPSALQVGLYRRKSLSQYANLHTKQGMLHCHTFVTSGDSGDRAVTRLGCDRITPWIG